MTKRSFGRAVRDARIVRTISQQQLAIRLRTTQSAVSSWETGGAVPDARKVASLEKALRVEPGALSSHLDFMPVGAVPADRVRVEEAIRRDPALNEMSKAALIAAYRELARPSRAATGSTR